MLYTRYIAKRFVEEATRRQVIVFTHDISFLLEIKNRCASRNLTVQTVKRFGLCARTLHGGVSWEAMVLRERLAHLDSLVNGHAPLYETDVVAYNKERHLRMVVCVKHGKHSSKENY